MAHGLRKQHSHGNTQKKAKQMKREKNGKINHHMQRINYQKKRTRKRERARDREKEGERERERVNYCALHLQPIHFELNAMACESIQRVPFNSLNATKERLLNTFICARMSKLSLSLSFILGRSSTNLMPVYFFHSSGVGQRKTATTTSTAIILLDALSLLIDTLTFVRTFGQIQNQNACAKISSSTCGCRLRRPCRRPQRYSGCRKPKQRLSVIFSLPFRLKTK